MIITYPNNILTKESEKVTDINDETLDKIGEMHEIIESKNALGLSAVQIGWPVKIFVLNKSIFKCEHTFINPKITKKTGKTDSMEECLSVPGLRLKIKRSNTVQIIAMGLDMEEFELSADGLLSNVIQHEYDHCMGMLFTIKASPSDKKKTTKHLELLKSISEMSHK